MKVLTKIEAKGYVRACLCVCVTLYILSVCLSATCFYGQPAIKVSPLAPLVHLNSHPAQQGCSWHTLRMMRRATAHFSTLSPDIRDPWRAITFMKMHAVSNKMNDSITKSI